MNIARTARVTGRGPGLAAKRAFLESGAAWPGEPPPLCLETHASLVFLTRQRAFKLKKPVRMPHADMRRLSARRHFCEEELRLNRALAGAVYRGLVPVTVHPGGGLALGGPGRVVDWLVEMDRLPAADMLDQRILGDRPPDGTEIARVGACLVAFYGRQPASPAHARAYHARLSRELATDIAHLREMAGLLGPTALEALAARVPQQLEAAHAEIAARGAAGVVLEGHGDLRAEHVCLLHPPVLFDRVEFDHDFRLIDPHDEIGALGLDCERLGAPWIGPALTAQLDASGMAAPSDGLSALYRALRCLTQARLSIDHLRDAHPRTPGKWAPRARWFIAAARHHCG